MITQKYFEEYCAKIFNDDYQLKTEHTYSMELHVRCFFHDKLVARLRVSNNLKTTVDVYMPDECYTSTSYKWRFRYLLKKYTEAERNKAAIVQRIADVVNNKFYAQSEDIWYIIDKITDDIFALNLCDIAERLMDKADLVRYNEIRWRTAVYPDEAKKEKQS